MVSPKMNSYTEEQDSYFSQSLELSDLDAEDPLGKYAPW